MDYPEFLWVSDPEALGVRPGGRHSSNIAARPRVAIVIFDSLRPIGRRSPRSCAGPTVSGRPRATLPGCGVRRTALVGRGTALVREVRARDGRLVQRVRAGFALALDVAAVEPRAWAAALLEAERSPVARLQRGEVLLSTTAGRLRGVGAGATLVLAGDGRLKVRGVVPDEVAHSAELLTHLRDRRIQTRPRYVLALLRRRAGMGERRLERATEGEATRARLLFDGDDAGQAQEAPRVRRNLRRASASRRSASPYGEDWVRLNPVSSVATSSPERCHCSAP
jgi:hypothetical protein